MLEVESPSAIVPGIPRDCVPVGVLSNFSNCSKENRINLLLSAKIVSRFLLYTQEGQRIVPCSHPIAVSN